MTQTQRLVRYLCHWCSLSFASSRSRSLHETRGHGLALPEDVRRERIRTLARDRTRRFRADHPDYYVVRHADRKADPTYAARIAAYHVGDVRSGANAARKAIAYAVKRGRLIKSPCAVCGDQRVQAHHFAGYAQPHQLDVIWLCKLHHEAAHHEAVA